MAAFNLTAQLNLVGPTNVRQIVGDIRKQLRTIKGNIDLGIDPKAIRAIAQLQSQASQISSSLNNVSRSASVASGSINNLNNAASKNQLGSVAQSAVKAANAASDLGKESSRSSKDVKVLSNELAEFGRQSGLAIRRFVAFSLVSGVMYKLNSSINQALSQYIDFDRELVRVSQVTGKSVAELGSLVSEISSLATSTGVASKELIEVSSTLAQAGLSARDAEKALKALALSANAPSFDNLNDTVEGSIALMRQFGISADDLESALGSVNAVAAAFAVEASDLIAAIQRTGGVFASASRGVSEGTNALNEFIAVFTSVRATTRESAETIATGLRTIFTRIQRESTITALRELGVELRDVEGKFVGPYEAVRRLSEGLGQLDPRSQTFAAIVEELGGFRQIGKVIPLIQQFATAEAALQVAMKGGDSLAEANRQAQQALAVQLAKTREEFVALVRDFANNTAFRSFLTTTIGITKSILSLARAGRSLFPLLTIIGGFKAFSAVTQFAGGFMQGVRPSGGKGGGGDEEGIDNKGLSRTMGRSVSRSIGKGLGEMLSGSKTERQAESLEQIVSILRSNAQAFNTDVSSLSQPITSLSSLLNDNNSLLSANTSGLNNVYAALVNLEAAISSKSFTGPTTARGGGRILGFAKGGTVPGSGKGDKVPALLEPGEVVMSNRAVRQYGRGNLVRMNKYAQGGPAISKIKNLEARDGDSWRVEYIPEAQRVKITTRAIGYDAYEISSGRTWEKALGNIAKNMANSAFKDSKRMSGSNSMFKNIQQRQFDRGRPLHTVPDTLIRKMESAGVAKKTSAGKKVATGSSKEPNAKQIRTLKKEGYKYSGESNRITQQPKELATGGLIQKFAEGGAAQRNVGYIDYDVIANPANEAVVTKGMEATGQKGPRLYTDYLTQLAVKARKESSLQKLRAVYGVAGSGKTTLARGQGTDQGKLRSTNRFPILTPEDIQKANEVLILSSSVSKDKLDSFFSEIDRAYTLSSTTTAEKERIRSQRASRDVTGVGLEGRTPGGTMGVGKDTAIGEALLQDRLGSRSVVLGRSDSGKLRRKKGDELVNIIKKKIGFTWGGFAPMTAGHESILDAASAMGISPQDFIFLVGANEAIKGDAASYRTAIFSQDARVLLAKAGAGAKGATVLPKAADFEVPLGFDVSQGSGRRQVVLPGKGSKVFVGDKAEELTGKYKEAGYGVVGSERTGGISGTMVRDLIEQGNLGELQKVLSPGVYELISNNIGRIQNRARVLPEIISQVQASQAVKLADVEKAIKAVGVSRIDKKKLGDPEYAAKVQILEELRGQRDKIKSAAAFEPYKLLEELARSQPDQYGLDFSAGAAPVTKPIRTVGATQKASIGGLVQRFIDGGWVERMKKQTDAQLKSQFTHLHHAGSLLELGERKVLAGTFDPNKPWEDIGKRELRERMKAIQDFLEERKQQKKQTFANRKGSGLQDTEQYDTQEMLDAITYYQAGSGPFTKALAGGKKTFKDPRGEIYKTQDIRDRLLAASQFKIPKKTYSGLGRSQLKEILSDTGVTPKQLSSKPSEILKTLIGKNIDFPTFLSVSAAKSQAEAFVQNPGALLTIDGSSTNQKTIDIIKAKNKTSKATTEGKSRRLKGLDKISSNKLDLYDEEKEFVIPPNVGFRITKATGKVSSDLSRDLNPKKGPNYLEMYFDEDDDYFEKTKLNLAAQMLRSGGLVQRFMAGGQPEETAPWGDTATVPEILRLLTVSGAAKIGRVANPRELLKKHKPTEDEKAKIKAIRDEATKTYNRRIGAAKGVQTRLAGQGLKFAAVGMFGNTFPDETYDAQGTKGTRKVLITAALMDQALAEQLDADFGGGIESIAQQAAEKTMIGNITKGLLGGKQAEFDFDRTLAVGADDIASLKDFRDPTIVQEKLKNATLTRLGRELVDLVKAHPEILPNMRIVTARSQSTVPLIQQWLADKGLGLSDSQFVGVGGDAQIVSESDIPALKAAQLRAGSLFVDDSGPNIMAAEASGKNIEAYQYGAQLTIPNPNAEASVKGIIFEKMIQNLGGPGRVAGLGFDYPKGLGTAAKYFGIDPDIPTDAKRTIVGAGTIKDNVKTYLKAMGYKEGGKADDQGFEEVRKQIMDKYPEIDFRISKRKKGRGFGYNLLGALKTDGGLLGSKGLKFEQPSNLQKLIEVSDKMATSLINPQELAIGGLADATSEMASLMSGLYGNRSSAESAPAKKQKDFGRIGLSEDGDMITASYYKNDQRSGYVYAYKTKDNLYHVGLSKATSGYGPRLYDVIMEAVSEKGAMLTSDRSMVSAEAQRVWQYYFKNRGDVKKTPLEPEDWTKNQSLIDPKLYGRRETWPPATDPAWVLQSGYSKSPSLINDPSSVVRSKKKLPKSSGQMALEYFGRANGGRLGFADGGSVPALVSNGEAYVPPKLAKKIGYGTLSKMNQADKNGMGRFSEGGISVFKGPGSGTSDSIPTSLPVGSFIIREKATKALGLNKGGMVQRFADGGSPKGGTTNLYPGLDPKPFGFLEEMAIKAGNAFSSTESIFKNTLGIYDRYKSSFSNLMTAVDQYISALVQAGKLSVDRENLIFRAYEKAIIRITKIGDTKAAAKAEQELIAALDQATARVNSGIQQSAQTPTSSANPKPIPQIVPPVKDNLDIPSKDIYFSNLSSSKIRETVSKSKSPIKDIDVSSLDLLRSTAQDAGMSITEFASGLIKARDTAIQSALEQGQGIREAALAGQEAAIAFAKLSELRSVGQDPNDALRSLLASSSRVQANVQERKAILSDPAVIAAIQETNKLVANLSEDEKLTYEAMRGLSKAQREDPAIQGIVGQLTPALEKVFESRTRQKDVVGYTIEQRQERAQTPTFAAPSIAGPTNLMEVEGVNNALAQAKADAESYAQSLRDQANNIRKQKEVTIDPATLAGFEAKAQALEEKASEAEKTYGDLVNSTQDSVDWLDTEYQTAIDAMRIRAESAAKATQDVEKAMLQRAKEISAENPQLTAEEIGQKISIENVGIVAEAKAKQQEAQTAAGAAQSRVDTLAGTAGAGAAILAQDQAQAKAQAQAEADKAALEARKQQARDLGAKRAAIAVGGKRDYESDEEFEDRKKAATQKYTRQSAVEMGLAQTRFVSKREKESIEKQRQEEKAAKAQDLEKTKSTTDIQAQASETKATLLLVQALNANTNAQGGTTSALDEQVAALENSNKSLEEARIKNVEDKDANNKQTEDDSASFQDELRTIPFLDTLEDWSSSVNNFANGFAASSTDLNGKVSRMGGIFQGAASKIDSGIKGMAAALRNANTAFASTGLGKFADSFSQYGTVIGGGVTMVAQRLADMSDGFETTTGTIAQFAATTASQATIIGTMGAQFGPLGGIIGTVAGAAMGLTRAFFDMQNAARERARSELEMAKEDAMAEASASFELALSNSSSAAEDFKAGLEAMTTVINTEKELLKTDTKSSQFTRGFMGFGGVRQKTGRELQESVQSRAAAESGGAALSKQLLSGVMRSGNLTIDQTREKLGTEKFNVLGGQIAEADTTFINARLAAAEQMNKDIAAGMSKTDAENKYRGAVDTARDAAVRRALASQQAAIADEQYRKSVTEVRQRLEQQGTSFLKEIITATPKQRAEKRKDLEAAQGLMSGDMTKSRQQQQAAFQKAYRETSGTPMQKMEAAQQAAAETRNRQQAAAEQILSFGDQKDQGIRNARAQLLETSLREQGINPNEGMAKQVIDSLRQQDPELQAQERAASATIDNTKALMENTDALGGTSNDIYTTKTAENELGKEQRQTAITYGVGGATALAAGTLAYRRFGRKSTATGADSGAKSVTTEGAATSTTKTRIDPRTGQTITVENKPKVKPPPVPKTMAEAEARASKTKPPTTSSRGSRARSKGVFGLVRNLAVPAATAAVAAGAGYLAGGGGAEDAGDIPASPEIVQLLTAIENNTRNCCMGAGGKEATYTSAQTQQNQPAIAELQKQQAAYNQAYDETEGTVIEKTEAASRAAADVRVQKVAQMEKFLASMDPKAQQTRDLKANFLETQLKEQGIDPNVGLSKQVIENLRTRVEPVGAGQAKASIIAEQLQTKGVDISTDEAQEALSAIASSTDPAITSMSNVAAMSEMLAQKFGELSEASEISGESQAASGEEAQQAATETRSAALDWIQAGLDIAGLIPLFGEVADGANAAIYGLRAAASSDPGVQKDLMVDAGLSAAAMIPGIGMAAVPAKYGMKAAKAGTKLLGKTGYSVAKGAAGEVADYGIMNASEGAIVAGVESLPLGEAQNESMAQEAESGKGFITSAMESIGTTIWDSGAYLTSALQTGFGMLPGLLDGLFRNVIPMAASALWNGLKMLASGIYEGGVAAISTLWSGLKALPTVIYELGVSALSGLWESTKVLGSVMIDTAMAAIGGLWEGVKALPGFIYETGMSALGSLWSGLSALPGMIIDGIIGMFSFGASVTSFIAEQIMNIGTAIYNGASAGIQYIIDIWPKLPDIIYQAFLDGSLFILDGMAAAGQWVQDQFFRVLGNITNGINDVAFSIISRIPGGKSLAKTLGLTDPAERAKQEKEKQTTENIAKKESVTTQKNISLQQKEQQIAQQKQQSTGAAGPAITGTALTQAVTQAQVVREQQALSPNTIVDQAGNFIPAVGPAGSGAAITGGSALMNEAAAYDAETIAAANAPAPNVLQQFESKATAGLPGETNNLFKNASADIARTQIPAPQPTQVSRGVINTGAPEGAAGMSQLFDTAAIGNALQTVFGQFVTDLQNVQLPKIPDLVTMEGKHTVEVILNGAEVLKSIEPMIKDLIDKKLTNFKTTINNATEGGISGM